MGKKKRIEEIDILKALGIICMVAGHSGVPIVHFIYLFHIAIFFMASGYFFKDQTTDTISSLVKSCKNKLLKLWLPFAIWNCVFVLLHNFFIKINIYSNNSSLFRYVLKGQNILIEPYSLKAIIVHIIKGLFFSSEEQLLGACWFLIILFGISIAYLLVDYLAKRISSKHVILIQTVISILFLFVGYYFSLHNISLHGIALVFSYYCLYFCGHIIRIYDKTQLKSKFEKYKVKYHVCSFLIAFGILLVLNRLGSIALNENKYENPLFLLVASISGWVFLYRISSVIKRIDLLKNSLLIIGRSTYNIMVLHFLAFKIVACIIVNYYKLPKLCIAAFPNLYGNKAGWWLLYTIVGIIIPVIFSLCLNKVKEHFKLSL